MEDSPEMNVGGWKSGSKKNNMNKSYFGSKGIRQWGAEFHSVRVVLQSRKPETVNKKGSLEELNIKVINELKLDYKSFQMSHPLW